MAPCLYCSSTPNIPSSPPESYSGVDDPDPAAGNIYVFEESIMTHIMLILNELNAYVSSDPASFTPLTHRSQGKCRPCIIVDVMRRDKSVSYTICIMTTFGGRDELATMPSVYSRFCLPIFPTDPHDPDHLHTIPEWQGQRDRKQWVVAHGYRTNNPALDPFSVHLDGRKWTYRVDEVTLEKLDFVGRNRLREWQERGSEDAKFVREMTDEFKAYNAERKSSSRTPSRSTTMSSPLALTKSRGSSSRASKSSSRQRGRVRRSTHHAAHDDEVGGAGQSHGGESQTGGEVSSSPADATLVTETAKGRNELTGAARIFGTALSSIRRQSDKDIQIPTDPVV